LKTFFWCLLASLVATPSSRGNVSEDTFPACLLPQLRLPLELYLWKQNKTKKKSVEKDQRREKIAVAKTTVASSNEVMEENEETLQQTERERNTKLKWTKKLRETKKKRTKKFLQAIMYLKTFIYT
jgi:hypothetical protein